MNRCLVVTLLWLFFCSSIIGQTARIEGFVVNQKTRVFVSQVEVNLKEVNQTIKTNSKGKFVFKDLKEGDYTIQLFADNFQPIVETVLLKKGENKQLTFELDLLSYDLGTVEIGSKRDKEFGLRRLDNVEGTAIYAAKKSEVIVLENAVANLATNNARQIFKGIAGLNIHENDGAGLQLSIGARGLDPNRTANFNTRQNGYDISADALGYPESYYTPPAQALKKIEIVRGAASLQYGPQFGGLLNFVFKDGGGKKPFTFQSQNTVGSFGLLSTFNSMEGQKGDWNYYTFYQRKQGDGWRPNSQFFQNTAYAQLRKKFGKKLKITGEFTKMNYLAQQPGGLVDFEFENDPRQSKRTRNWFKVNWNLGALIADYQFSEKTKINSRFFVLSAERLALGILNQINRPDPMRERDLISGKYNNWGNETRLVHRYKLGAQLTTFLTGFRIYNGYAETAQGLADDGADANFNFLNINDLEGAAYEFPSQNFSFFVENLFNITNRWTITPGARFEYIKTAADGFFKRRFISGNQVLREDVFLVERAERRNIILLGLGTGYRLKESLEVYSNFSQNYRSINFSDLAILNPNLVVDSLLMDERGSNLDLGFRGSVKDYFTMDFNLFLLNYKDRIGVGELIIEDPSIGRVAVPFRTNIGDAIVYGFEGYVEADIFNILQKENSDFGLKIFTNLSFLKGTYISGGSAFEGNDIELIPPFSLKTGFNFLCKNFKVAGQFASVAQHFSDATNATQTADATRGIIPSYSVVDFSTSYNWKRFSLQSGINNLLNKFYFTRRATAYPGPGIIPADGRNFYLTFGIKI